MRAGPAPVPPSSCMSCYDHVKEDAHEGVAAAHLVFAVHGITAATNASGTWATRTVIAPAGAFLPIRTITSHVPGVATNAADDVCREVLLLGAVILTMTNLATILTCLVFVITKGSVKSGQFTQLVALQLILALRYRSRL